MGYLTSLIIFVGNFVKTGSFALRTRLNFKDCIFFLKTLNLRTPRYIYSVDDFVPLSVSVV